MRILLSAYSCRPNEGSEQGIGWNWAVSLARLGHHVLLLSREVDAPFIRAGLASIPEGERIEILSYDAPWYPNRAKTGLRFVRIHFLWWQICVYFWIRKRIDELKPELIQHITWGVFRLPCLLGLLGIPTIFGPLGGGERARFGLRYRFTLRAHAFEIVRDALNKLVAVDPLMTLAFARSTLIAARTEETRRAIPRRFRPKVFVHSGLGVDSVMIERAKVHAEPIEGRALRVLFVGRIVYWKGINYVLASFARFLQHAPDAELTIVGQGGDKSALQRFAKELSIDERIHWIDYVEHSRMEEVYQAHDVLLFPSLHDSGGLVVLEALGHGLPVIALDLGGPPQFVDESCGRIVATAELRPDELVERLARALEEIADAGVRRRLAVAARQRVRQFLWEERVREFYRVVDKALGTRSIQSAERPEDVRPEPDLQLALRAKPSRERA